MPNLDRRRGLLARLDAVQKVPHVVVARMIFFLAGDPLWPDALRRREKVLAHVVDAHQTFGAFKNAADRRLRREAFEHGAVRVVLTNDGQVITGVVAGETSTAVTLRGPDNKTTTILRVDIDEINNSGKSLMPEGFEKLIDKKSMADLLSFLKNAAAQSGAVGVKK